MSVRLTRHCDFQGCDASAEQKDEHPEASVRLRNGFGVSTPPGWTFTIVSRSTGLDSANNPRCCPVPDDPIEAEFCPKHRETALDRLIHDQSIVSLTVITVPTKEPK